jgi:hypothetical protein
MPLIVPRIPPSPPAPTRPRRTPFQVTYIDPDGVVWPWSDVRSGLVATTVTGIGGPPVGLTSLALPGGGMLAQSYEAVKRDIVIGLVVFNDSDQQAFHDLLDRLTLALWTERAGQPAAGTLVFTRPNGTSRRIEVYCTSGLEQDETASTVDAYQWTTTFGLTFESALDPLFSDDEAIHLAFEPPPPSGGVPPMPPVVLKPRAALGITQVTNEGNGPAYPIWKITGPGTPTITNLTTGRSFGLATALQEGETVTIDTRPARQSVVDQDGNDRWSDLVKASPRDLWALPAGTSELELEIANSDAGSKIEMFYQRRWLRA